MDMRANAQAETESDEEEQISVQGASGSIRKQKKSGQPEQVFRAPSTTGPWVQPHQPWLQAPNPWMQSQPQWMMGAPLGGMPYNTPWMQTLQSTNENATPYIANRAIRLWKAKISLHAKLVKFCPSN